MGDLRAPMQGAGLRRAVVYLQMKARWERRVSWARSRLCS